MTPRASSSQPGAIRAAAAAALGLAFPARANEGAVIASVWASGTEGAVIARAAEGAARAAVWSLRVELAEPDVATVLARRSEEPVLLDGRPLGGGPRRIAGRPGKHALRFLRAGYRTAIRAMMARTGGRRSFRWR